MAGLLFQLHRNEFFFPHNSEAPTEAPYQLPSFKVQGSGF
jgi:hypothetical protein